jgi:hypothetical protein
MARYFFDLTNGDNISVDESERSSISWKKPEVTR